MQVSSWLDGVRKLLPYQLGRGPLPYLFMSEHNEDPKTMQVNCGRNRPPDLSSSPIGLLGNTATQRMMNEPLIGGNSSEILIPSLVSGSLSLCV
jgi:hypothetical protein